MSELAFNINGEPFDVPPTMAAWRVRKLKHMGAPVVVFGRDGLPLFLPMDATVEDLRREAWDGPGAVGRYRLDPVDDRNRLVPDAPASYVYLHPVERAPEPVAPAAPAMVQTDATAQLIAALLESQKQHTELARMYVSQFPVLANAMAAVVRSAGDVGLTARVPLVMPVAPEAKPAEDSGDKDDESEDDETDDGADVEESAPQVAPEPECNWPRVAQSALELVNTHLGPLLSGIKLPGMGARPAANDGAQRAERTPNATEATEPHQGAPAADIMAHLNAIRAALTPEEGAFVMVMAEEMPLPVKLAWAKKLHGMSVPEAVASIRAELAELERNRIKAERAPASRASSAPSPAPSSAPATAQTAPTPPNAATVQRREGRPTASSTVGARVATETPTRTAAMSPATLPVPPTAPNAAQPLVDAPAQAHITAIQRVLTAEENAAMRRHFVALSPADRAAWIATLLMLPVPEAVATIRAELATAERAAVAPADVAQAGGGERRAAPTIRAELAADRAGVPPAGVAHWGEDERHVEALRNHAAPTIRAELTAERASVVPADVAHPGEDERHAEAAISEAASRNRAALADSAVAADARPKNTAPRAEMPAAALTAPERSVAAPAGAPAVGTLSATVPVAVAAPVPVAAPLPVAAPTAAPQTVETNAHIHLAAIESALTPDERERVNRMIAMMSPDDRDMWLDRLLSVSAAEGAAIFRDALHELTTQELASEELASEELASEELASEELASEELDGGEPDSGELTRDDGQESDGDEELDDAQELELDDHQEQADGATEDRPAPRPSSAPTAPAATESSGLPTLDPAALTRFAAIENALTLAEKMRAHELAARLPAAELRTWINELVQLPVPEAVAKIRAALAIADRDPQLAKKGGVS